ncbi:hypothetical protein VCV18_007059 [Metarhizium anisopliae]
MKSLDETLSVIQLLLNPIAGNDAVSPTQVGPSFSVGKPSYGILIGSRVHHQSKRGERRAISRCASKSGGAARLWSLAAPFRVDIDKTTGIRTLCVK